MFFNLIFLPISSYILLIRNTAFPGCSSIRMLNLIRIVTAKEHLISGYIFSEVLRYKSRVAPHHLGFLIVSNRKGVLRYFQTWPVSHDRSCCGQLFMGNTVVPPCYQRRCYLLCTISEGLQGFRDTRKSLGLTELGRRLQSYLVVVSASANHHPQHTGEGGQHSPMGKNATFISRLVKRGCSVLTGLELELIFIERCC